MDFSILISNPLINVGVVSWILAQAIKTVLDALKHRAFNRQRLAGWRQRSYPLEVYAGKQLIWAGNTERSLGYVHLLIDKPVCTDTITICLKGAAKDADAFGQITEVEASKAGEFDLIKTEKNSKKNKTLRIIEIEFLQTIQTE